MRGFSCVGLINPKFDSNVGSAIRACGCYGAAAILIQGERYQKSKQDTQKAERHIPVFNVDSILSNIPLGATVVSVEISDKARSIFNFVHPESAVYIFGPEDGSIPKDVIDRSGVVVYIPTKFCLNLSQAVATVLYDRALKRNE